MKTNLERLKKWATFGYGTVASQDIKEAAAEIEELREKVKSVEERAKKRCPVVMGQNNHGYNYCCNKPVHENRTLCKEHYDLFVQVNSGILGPFL